MITTTARPTVGKVKIGPPAPTRRPKTTTRPRASPAITTPSPSSTLGERSLTLWCRWASGAASKSTAVWAPRARRSTSTSRWPGSRSAPTTTGSTMPPAGPTASLMSPTLRPSRPSPPTRPSRSRLLAMLLCPRTSPIPPIPPATRSVVCSSNGSRWRTPATALRTSLSSTTRT